ncbi:MAG: hypothetical protein R3178_08715, partial [Rhodothermales bacterium]|nr:hypothetical protein [Rhodothermales bacterium]
MVIIRFLRNALLIPLILLAACDSTDSQDDFVKAAQAPPAGFTTTDASGQVIAEDTDDWRTSPFFVGKVVVNPAYPNPGGAATTVTVPIRILQFDDLTGGLLLRADVDDRLRLLDEL